MSISNGTVGSKEKYDETIDIFQDEEYGYIMETNDVVDLIQCTNDEAIDIVKCICFCPGMLVSLDCENSLTFYVVFALMFSWYQS